MLSHVYPNTDSHSAIYYKSVKHEGPKTKSTFDYQRKQIVWPKKKENVQMNYDWKFSLYIEAYSNRLLELDVILLMGWLIKIIIRFGLVWFGFIAYQPLLVIYCHFYTYKQFYFKQFSLAVIRCLNVKTVLFQTVQFSVSIQFSSIWRIFKQFCLTKVHSLILKTVLLPTIPFSMSPQF